MNLEFSDGKRKTIALDGFEGVTIVAQPLTVRQAASSAFDTLAVIRHGVLSIHGITAGGVDVTTGAELADALSRAQAKTDTMTLANKIVETIMELTRGSDEKNSESSPQSS